MSNNKWCLFQDTQETVDTSSFQFMTTISMPVYDRRENAVSNIWRVHKWSAYLCVGGGYKLLSVNINIMVNWT